MFRVHEPALVSCCFLNLDRRGKKTTAPERKNRLRLVSLLVFTVRLYFLCFASEALVNNNAEPYMQNRTTEVQNLKKITSRNFQENFTCAFASCRECTSCTNSKLLRTKKPETGRHCDGGTPGGRNHRTWAPCNGQSPRRTGTVTEGQQDPALQVFLFPEKTALHMTLRQLHISQA